MTRRSMNVSINPEVLKWLRVSSGWQIEEVAKRLSTSRNTILSLEKGTKKPTIRQLQILSTAFRRPLISFLLPEPQEEKPLPKDYRQIPNKQDIFDKKTLLAIRKARQLQSLSSELASNTNEKISFHFTELTIDDDSNQLASLYRERFNLTDKKQRDFENPYQLFKYLRFQIEELNILVFQFSMPVIDARGFTLSDEIPAVIVVNSKDNIKARIFTLMHEFAHVLLGETIINLPELPLYSRTLIEKWCSEFASAFLLPDSLIFEIYEKSNDRIDETKILNRISNKYKLSKAMILYNFFKKNFITKELYDEVLNRYQESIIRQITQGGGIPPDQMCLSTLGNKFVSIVADNFEGNYITYSDALSYLSIKSKTYDKVLLKVVK